MTEDSQTTVLRKIKRLYGRILITVGTIMGFALCTFAFTLGIQIDGSHADMLEFEVPVAVLLVLGLIYLKPLSLVITRLLFVGERRRLVKGMTVADIEKLPQ